MPWLQDDVHARLRRLDDRQVEAALEGDDGAPPGTRFARFNGSPFPPTRMADLRGVRDRRDLDATGTRLHRGPGDIARYAILVEHADEARFGEHSMLPKGFGAGRPRASDEALCALALQIESLDPAPSPYAEHDLARRGERILEAEGCDACHPPPAYANDLRVAVPGFEPPRDDPRSAALGVSTRRVGTDPGLALETRKGTGYDEVHSLRGLWHRGLSGHDGSVSSLEDCFDPRRTRDDCVPTGWRGRGARSRAVPGQDFVLDLEDDEKRALVAFLRTP